MAKKKKVVEKKLVEIGRATVWDCGDADIPTGATQVKLNIDYDNCYYQNDTPNYTIIFMKEEDV